MSVRFFIVCSLILVIISLKAQQEQVDTLRQRVSKTSNDTLTMVWLMSIARIYAEINPDSARHYSEGVLQIAQKMNFKLEEAHALREIGYSFMNLGNYVRALQLMSDALEMMENPAIEKNVLVGEFPGDDLLMYRQALPHDQRLSAIAFNHQLLGILYANANNFDKAVYHHRIGRSKAEQSGNLVVLSLVNLTLNRVYLQLNNLDSALNSIQRSHDLMIETGYKKYLGSALLNMGRTYAVMGENSRAVQYYRESLKTSIEFAYYRGIVASSLLLAESNKQSGSLDSAFLYINMALAAAKNLDSPELWLRNFTALANYYKITGNKDSVVKYQALIIKINENQYIAKQIQQFQNIDFETSQRQLELDAIENQFKVKLQRNILIGSLGTFTVISLLLWRNIRQKKRSSAILQKQKEELEQALENLKITQKQLIQSEKMASLGELTAGIAHEIQNPLNFVNNFSEVNKELLIELGEEIKKGNLDEVNAIAKNIIDNEEKIMFHGKRADAIVKGMLQHSRTSSGVKEPTDINALADEYLRLAYHGLRAKDKSFNATMKTEFDESLGKINVVPQEIGRVILNLITNAFYACNERLVLSKAEGSRSVANEKKKQLASTGSVSTFEPTVIVSTKKSGDKVLISVADNGNGIPQIVLDKVFQPFFTTKPAGQGTGLGLSMSYEIVTKSHNGELKVKTAEGEGSTFIIILPI